MKTNQFSGAIVALGALATSLDAATTLISGSSTEDLLNGNFTATAGWVATGALTPAQFATNFPDDLTSSSGGQNAVLGLNGTGDIRSFGRSTGHIAALGDVFTLDFDWLDANDAWIDTETIGATLFFTDDNLITGTRTVLASFTTPDDLVDLDWVSSGSLTSAAVTDADDGSRTVFLDFTPNADAGSFARIDDVNLSVEPVPEPSSTALLGLGGLALILRRRK